MSEPTNEGREPQLDPSDPRWVEDVLARARRRAEEGRPPVRLSGDEVTAAPLEPATSPIDGRAVPAIAPLAMQTVVPTRTVARTLDETRAAAPIEIDPNDFDAPTPSPSRPNPRPSVATSAPVIVDAPATIDERDDATTLLTGVAPDAAELDLADDDVDPPDRRMRGWLEWGAVILGALLVAFLIRAVLFQAFYIPSESMEPALEVSDRLLVNKLSYRLHDVNRGDIVVFERPPGETSKIKDLIKRVIALPGETVQQQGGDIYIDRGQGPQKLTETYIKDASDIGPSITWVQGCANPSTESTKCTIPAGHLWVMGDNRGHSQDSRSFGPIDEDLIVGRAFVKVWPLNKIGFL